MTIAFRGPTFMKVCGAREGVTQTAVISSSGSSAFRFTPGDELAARGTRRTPRTDAHSISAPSTVSGGSASPGRATTCRDSRQWCRGSGSAANRPCATPRQGRAAAAASSPCIASVYVSPEPSRSDPFSRDQPRSSATRFRSSIASGRAAIEVERHHQIGATLDRRALRLLRLEAQRLVQRTWSKNVHRPDCTVLPQWLHPFPGASRSRAATSPQTSSSGAGGAQRVHARVARDRRRDRRRLRRRDSATTRVVTSRRHRSLGRPGLHRRAHAPGVVEAPARRVRAPRPAARHDRGRRRSARDRERPRHRRRPLADRRNGRTAARRLLHGLVVRPGLVVRVSATPAHAGRPRRTPSAPSGDRDGRDDELPRRDRSERLRARQARARHACRRPRAGRRSGTT